MDNIQQEAYQTQENECRESDREREATQKYDHDEHETTTFERKQYNEEVEQDVYERDDKLGAI